MESLSRAGGAMVGAGCITARPLPPSALYLGGKELSAAATAAKGPRSAFSGTILLQSQIRGLDTVALLQ